MAVINTLIKNHGTMKLSETLPSGKNKTYSVSLPRFNSSNTLDQSGQALVDIAALWGPIGELAATRCVIDMSYTTERN